MTSSLNFLADEIFDIKEKLSNQEYLNICTHLTNCYNEKEKDKKIFATQEQQQHETNYNKILYNAWKHNPFAVSIFMIVISPIITVLLIIKNALKCLFYFYYTIALTIILLWVINKIFYILNPSYISYIRSSSTMNEIKIISTEIIIPILNIIINHLDKRT